MPERREVEWVEFEGGKRLPASVLVCPECDALDLETIVDSTQSRRRRAVPAGIPGPSGSTEEMTMTEVRNMDKEIVRLHCWTYVNATTAGEAKRRCGAPRAAVREIRPGLYAVCTHPDEHGHA